MNKIRTYLVFFGSLMMGACTSITKLDTSLPKVKTARLVEHLDSLAGEDWTHFYAKTTTKYSSSTTKVSFKTTLKMTKDSAMNATITFAAIPIIHVLLNPDSLKVVNKKDKCYILESVDFLKKQFDFPFGYSQVEELLLGRPLAWNKEDRFHQVENSEYYILTTTKKRYEDKRKEEGSIEVNYMLRPDNKDIERIIINSPKDSTSILMRYSDKFTDNKHSFHQGVEVGIYTPRDTISVELKYQKAEFESAKEMFFVIPESYERCK